MALNKKPVSKRVNFANLNIVRKTSGFLVLLIPVCLICALLIFKADIFDIAVILPAISMEAASIGFFVFSASFTPRARKGRPGAEWFGRAFWLLALNALMFVANGVDFGDYKGLAFGLAVLIPAVVPMIDNPEYVVVFINELVWAYFMAQAASDINGALFAYIGITVVLGFVSRYVYSVRVKLLIMQHRLGDMTKDALVDPLTGLFNRRGFDRQVESIWPFVVRNENKVALLIIDIDNFKAFNDEYGHPEGDECLKEVSECIRATAKRTTDIGSRIGGEEFLVFIQGNKEDEMVEFAETIRRNVEKMAIPHSRNAAFPVVTVSIGLSIASPRGMDINMLYEAADVELYQAKDRGRNQISYAGRVRRRYTALA